MGVILANQGRSRSKLESVNFFISLSIVVAKEEAKVSGSPYLFHSNLCLICRKCMGRQAMKEVRERGTFWFDKN